MKETFISVYENALASKHFHVTGNIFMFFIESWYPVIRKPSSNYVDMLFTKSFRYATCTVIHCPAFDIRHNDTPARIMFHITAAGSCPNRKDRTPVRIKTPPIRLLTVQEMPTAAVQRYCMTERANTRGIKNSFNIHLRKVLISISPLFTWQRPVRAYHGLLPLCNSLPWWRGR